MIGVWFSDSGSNDGGGFTPPNWSMRPPAADTAESRIRTAIPSAAPVKICSTTAPMSPPVSEGRWVWATCGAARSPRPPAIPTRAMRGTTCWLENGGTTTNHARARMNARKKASNQIGSRLRFTGHRRYSTAEQAVHLAEQLLYVGGELSEHPVAGD